MKETDSFKLSLEEQLAVLTNKPFASESELNFYMVRPASEFKNASPQFKEYLKRGLEVYEVKKTIEARDRKAMRKRNKAESADMHQGLIEDHKQIENLGEGEGNSTSYEVWTASDSLDVGQSEYLDIEDFFSRPIEIADFSIPLNFTVSNTYSIWNLYTINQSVRAKLKNFAFLRGNLHLRVVITGSPFHAGRLLISYQPFADRNLNLTSYATLGVNARNGLLNYLSQSKLCVIADVKNNTPIEMKIPYISHKPAIRLYNTAATVVTDLTPFEDANDLGDLYIYTLNQIIGPPAASSVRVQIYAYMSEVDLGVPTSTQLTLVTESEELDERKTGPVEAVSSSIVEWMSKLERVPALAPLALPSKMIASGISGVASLYGWSYPYTINNANRVKNEPYQNGSQTIGMSTSRKISLDPKQELTVDPRLGGDIVDELSIPYLCSKKTYLYSFDWDVSDVTGVPIFGALVHPGQSTVFSATNVYQQPTPMAMVSHFFKYWRGDIVFTFEFVTSNFDRGKIGILYEPNISQYPLISTAFELNKNFIEVIDLQDTQCVSYCINWAKDRAWLQCYPSGTGNVLGTNPVTATDQAYYANGIVALFPFTGLTNNDGSPVRVNVYIHGKNMHFNQVSDTGLPSNRTLTESDDKSTIPIECVELNPTSATDRNISVHHFGEEVHSLRSLIKRFVTTYAVSIGAGVAGDNSLNINLPIYPIADPIYGGTASVRKSAIRFLPLAFMAMRGSVRFRVNVQNSYELQRSDRVSVTLAPPTTSTPTSTVAWTSARPAMDLNGSLMFIPSTNAGVEFELPCYTNNLFLFAFTADYVGPNNNNGVFNTNFSKQVNIVWPGDYTKAAYVTVESAAGEDFSFYGFTGAPFLRV